MTVKGAAIISGVVGFLLGGGLTYLYMSRSNEEASEVIPYVPKSEREEKGNISKPNIPEDVKDDPVLDYVKACEKKSYSQMYNETVEINKDEISLAVSDKPYVIEPKDCQELPGYNFFTLKYYNDGYLVDEHGEPLDDPERVVGNDFMNHFDEFEEDTVYVRNDAIEADFMIIHLDTDFEI